MAAAQPGHAGRVKALFKPEPGPGLQLTERPDPVAGPEDVVRGQYGRGSVEGEEVPGYREEEGVDPQSATETFGGESLGVLYAAYRNRDLIVFDQRGTGRSGLLRCRRLERANLLQAGPEAAACARQLGPDHVAPARYVLLHPHGLRGHRARRNERPLKPREEVREKAHCVPVCQIGH